MNSARDSEGGPLSSEEHRTTPSEAKGTILTGGIALVGGAVAFLGVFSYLAAHFNYPEVLDGNARGRCFSP